MSRRSTSTQSLVITLCAALLLACLMVWLSKKGGDVTPPETASDSPAAQQERRPVKFVKGEKKVHPTVDKRDGVSAPTMTKDRATALKALEKDIPGVQVDLDPLSGAPARIQATGRFLSTPAAGTATDALTQVGGFLDTYAGVFGHDSSALKTSRVLRNDVTNHNGMTTLVWQQEIDGVPIFNTILKANVTKRGDIITINSHYLKDPKPTGRLTDNVVGAAEAISKALQSIEDEIPAANIVPSGKGEGKEQRTTFKAKGISDTSAQYTYMPTGPKTVRPAYDITTFSLAKNEMFRMVVDAETGELLYRQSLTADISDATYNVFADSTTLQPFDSPAPMTPGLSTPGTTQPPLVPRQLVTTSAQNTTASPNGWINDGDTQTLGNNVDAHTDTNADNLADLPRPTSPTRVFDFNVDFNQSPTTYKDALVTQLFYMNNWVHDKMYALGFTESAGNFQTNNFGRGGQGNDAVQADAQDGSGTNNANFSTPADGTPGRMQMYLWTSPNPDRDSDFDNEIIIHEYTHGLSNRLVGGGIGMSALQSRGMGEGWSDFYAISLLSQSTDGVDGSQGKGGYSTYQLSGMTTNYYFGIRRYPYGPDMNKSPLTFRDIDPVQASPHSGVPLSPRYSSSNSVANQVHAQGEVWCNALWDVRRNLILKHGYAVGNQLVLQLVTDGMKLAPANPNFLQARDGILQADLVNNAGANLKEMWAGFAKRGMGLSATSPVSSATTGVVEAFDVPGALVVSPGGSFDPLGIPGGPFSVSSTNYTVTNNTTDTVDWTATKQQSWTTVSPAGGQLAPGQSTVVTWSLNTNAESLPALEHLDTLTITDTTHSLVQNRPLRLTINSNPLAQTITFAPLAPKATTSPPVTLSATATSGLSVTFTLLSGPATLAGNILTLTGSPGAVTIKASQSGNALFLPAADVTRSFVVGTGFQFSKVVASAFGNTTYAIMADGTLWSWGAGGSTGSLGEPSVTTRITPTKIGTATNWVEVAPAATHALGLRSNGTLWAWGLNSNGQLGFGDTSTRMSPIQVGSVNSWSKLVAGGNHTVALRSNGTLWAWGQNSTGQVGDGTTSQQLSTVQIGTATNWTAIAAGSQHTLAVNSLGELWAWGSNNSSQLGDGTTSNALLPIKIGTDTNWVSVAAGSASSYAIKSNGTLWAWGSNSSGQIGDGTFINRTTPTQISAETNWTSVTAGSFTAGASKSDGTLWIWGSNANGQYGNGSTTSSQVPVQFGTGSNWSSITLGVNHATGMQSDGTLWTAGESNAATGVSPRSLALASPTLGTWTTLAGRANVYHAIRSDNTLWAWGSGSVGNLGTGTFLDLRTPTQIGTATDWKQVVAGNSFFSVAVKTTGTLWTWGSNSTSQLGDGTTTTRPSPTQIGTATDWAYVAAGGAHGLAVKTTGALWAWGSNSSSQLGDGGTTTRTAPIQIGSATDWVRVYAGSANSFGIRTNGTLWAWGNNPNGQLGDGTQTTRSTPVQVGSANTWTEVSAGTSHTIGRRTNGTLWAWGAGANGQLGNGATANVLVPVQIGTDTDWAKIFANGNTTIAIKSNGSLWTCGQNHLGQRGDSVLADRTTLAQLGSDTSWTLAACGDTSFIAYRSGIGFFGGGASAGPRTMAAGRDARLLAPILPPLQSQSLNPPASNYNTYQSPITLTTTSGLAPAITLVSGPATINGNQITLTDNGTVTIVASQYGDDFSWNSIPPTRYSFTVGNTLGVTFPSLGSIGLTAAGFDARNVQLSYTLGFAPTLGTTLTLVDNTSSNPITGTLPGTPDGSYIAMSFGGTNYGFRVVYNGGDGNDIVLIHEVADQSINFTQINPKSVSDLPFNLEASTISGLPVTFSVVTGPATVVGNTLTLTGVPGAVTIRASQSGSSLWNPATDVLQTFVVGNDVSFVTIAAALALNTYAAIRSDGSLWMWGTGTAGNLGDGTTSSRLAPTQVGLDTDWWGISLSQHTLALRLDGTLWGWGLNTSGQVGDGTLNQRFLPVQIGIDDTWIQVSASPSSASYGLKTDGTLWAWGSNTNSQLGDGTTITRLAPTQIGTATNWQVVTSGNGHAAALRSDGTLWTWGLNSAGQLGHGDTNTRSTPTQVGSATDWLWVAAGNLHTVALKTDGTLWSWGSNTSGQLGDGTTVQKNVPVQAGFDTDWDIVTAGNLVSVAKKLDGTLWICGSNSSGQIGDGTTTNRSSWVRIGSADDWSYAVGSAVGELALKNDGTIWSIGDSGGNSGRSPRTPGRAMANGNNIAIAYGNAHGLVLKADGTLYGFGSSALGQLGNGTFSSSDPVQVGTGADWRLANAGVSYSGGIRSNGTLWMWGSNFNGQLGDGTGTTRSTPVQIGVATDWSKLALPGNGTHSVALKTGGTLWTWGSNTSSQLGDGTTTSKFSPIQIGTDSDWSAIAAGSSHTLAIKSGGTLWAWGANTNSQLGDGTTTLRSTPTQIGTDTQWAKVATYSQSSYAIKTDGSLWAWGNNSSGQLGDGTTSLRSNPVQIAIGSTWRSISSGGSHAAAIKSDGTLWAWGANSGGQLGTGNSVSSSSPQQVGSESGWIAVACGSVATTALREDGSVWTFGNSSNLSLTSLSGRSQYAIAPVVPELWPQTLNPLPVGTNPYRFSASSGLPVQLSVITGQATVTGNEVNLTGPPGEPVTILAWQQGDESAWNAAGPKQYTFGTFVPPDIGSIAEGNITGTSVSLSGFVNPNGALTTVMFEYGPDPGLATSTSTAAQSVGSNNVSVPVSAPPISGLPEATTIYYRLIARNAGGTQTSSIQHFDTLVRDIVVEAPIGNALSIGDTVSLGAVSMGTSATSPITVKNVTPGTTIITGPISISGPDASMFSVSVAGYGNSISGGTGSTFSVTFTPLLGGPRSATLSIPSNDPDEPTFTLNISGTGQVEAGPAQTLIGPASLPQRFVADGPVTLNFVSTSGLAPTYEIIGGTGGTISGNTFTPNPAGGPVTLKVTQAGGSGYDAATPVIRTFQVAAGKFAKLAFGPASNHSLGIKEDGSLWAWGRNLEGQLGDGTVLNSHAFLAVAPGSTWSVAAVGGDFSVGIKTNGTLWTWGNNGSGQLGQGDSLARLTPTQVGIGTTWSNIAAGSNFVIAVQSNGTLWAWGNNANGQLGLGDTTNRNVPSQVGAATNWSSLTGAIAAGSTHAVARNVSGNLFAWGANTFGQLGTGDNSPRTTPVQIGTSTLWFRLACTSTATLAVQSIGGLYAWGSNASFELGDGTLTNRNVPTAIGTAFIWTNVAGGNAHAIATRSDGTLWSWGTSSTGALGGGSRSARSSPIRVGTDFNWSTSIIAAGAAHSLALKSDGSLWTAGSNEVGQLATADPEPVALGTSVKAVATGTGVTHFLKTDGTVWGLGSNLSDVGDGTSTSRPSPVLVASDVAALAAGQQHTLALTNSGTIIATGVNGSGQLGDGTTVTKTSWVPAGTNNTWTKIAAGGSHSAAIRSDGSLWAWGANNFGQVGDGTTTTRQSPVRIGTDNDWVAVACGTSHTLGLKSTGSLWAWGSNVNGRLGDGTTINRSIPVLVGGAFNWAKISAGGAHSLGIRTNGNLYVWGANSLGAVGDGSLLDRLSPVLIGSATDWAAAEGCFDHTLALKTDGTLWAWGGNSFAQNGMPDATNSPVQLLGGLKRWTSLGDSHSQTTHIIDETGTLWAWGNNVDLQVGSGSRVHSQFESSYPGLSPQSIAFPTILVPAFNNPVTLSATSTSGLPVNFYAGGAATLNGNQLTITGPGPVTLFAHQPGDRTTWGASAITAVPLSYGVTDVVSLTSSTGSLSPVISPSVNTYVGTFNLGTTTATITPTLLDPLAQVTVNGTPVPSGTASGSISLGSGTTSISIVVTGRNMSTTRTITVRLAETSPFEDWAATQSTSTDPVADPDGDHIINLLEYAFGLNPSDGDPAPISVNAGVIIHPGPPSLVPPVTGDIFHVIYGRRSDYLTMGLTYTVYFSDNLATWEASQASPVVIADDGSIQACQVPVPVMNYSGQRARFFKVTVDAP